MYNKMWWEKNRDEYGPKMRAQRAAARKANPEKKMLHAARFNAKAKGVPFNITLADISIPQRCPVLGIGLRWTDGRRTDHTPSLDRLVPELGYTKGNVRVISWRANNVKSNATPQELEAVASWLRRTLKPLH